MYEELTQLFKKYNLNITIPDKKVNSRQQKMSIIIYCK